MCYSLGHGPLLSKYGKKYHQNQLVSDELEAYRYWYSVLDSGAFTYTSFDNSLEKTINNQKKNSSNLCDEI